MASLRNKLSFLMVVFAAAFFSFFIQPVIQPAQAQDWTVKKYGSAVTYTTQVTFTDDSLKAVWLKAIPVGDAEFQGVKTTMSWRSLGSATNVFNIAAYLTNFLKAPGSTALDSLFLNISQSWDTAGNNTKKPVNDTLNNALSGGAAMQWAYIKVDGLAGNGESTVVDLSVTFYLKEE